MRNSISKSNLTEIAHALREARIAKQMSQRALSARSGATQAQISRIENGEVDLQVSSLIELARALDMELVLTPKGALPAVEAVVRERNAWAHQRGLARQIANLERSISEHPIEDPNELLTASRALQEIAAMIKDPSVSAELKRNVSVIHRRVATGHALDSIAQFDVGNALRKARESLEGVREGQRPAYTLDDEEPDNEED